MKETTFPAKRILKVLAKYNAGHDVQALCQQYGITVDTLYEWHKTYGHTDQLLQHEVIALRKENKRLKEYCSNLHRDFQLVKELFETTGAS